MYKDIPWCNKYMVNENGEVYSKLSNKVLKKGYFKDGYVKYILHTDEGRKTVKGHRLVAQTFIPNPNNYPQVNHIDGNRENNNVNNLEWCTAKYNVNYSLKVLGTKFKGRKGKNVSVYNKKTGELLAFKSIRKCAEHFGFTRQVVSAILDGDYKMKKQTREKVNGFVIKYI